MRLQFDKRVLSWLVVVSFVTASTSIPLLGMSSRALASDELSALINSSFSEEEMKDGRKSRFAEGREKPKSCRVAQEEAHQSCSDPNSTIGLGPQGQQAMGQAQQQQQQMGSNAAQNPGMGGGGGACAAGALMSGLQALMAGLKGVGCSAATKDCEEACQDNPDAYCGSGDSTSATQALGAVFGLLGSMMQMQQCKKMQAQATPTPTPMDCSNPTYAQSNIQCICQADPKNTICTGMQQLPGGLTTTIGDMGPAGPSYTEPSDFTSDGSNALGFDGKAAVSKGSQTADGGGGGGPQGGRGGSFNGAGEGGYADRSNVDKNVIQGLAGGSGAGPAYGGGGGGSGSGNTGRGGGGSGERFDLSKFLPKAKTRGLAGMSITSKDGITGPMGPSIWEKVSNQYQLQRQNLIQDR